MLTKQQQKVLSKLISGALLENYYQGGWWIGFHQVNGLLCTDLIRLMAIRTIDSVEHDTYTISDIGRKMLKQAKGGNK